VPKFTAVHERRLRKLAVLLRGLTRREAKHFSMENWYTHSGLTSDAASWLVNDQGLEAPETPKQVAKRIDRLIAAKGQLPDDRW
jgi:hypothetical protein